MAVDLVKLKEAKARKAAALTRDEHLGFVPGWIGADGFVTPTAQKTMLQEMHAAHGAYLQYLTGRRAEEQAKGPKGEDIYVPRHIDTKALDALLGVEGYTMPGRHASFNKPSTASFTGPLQLGESMFGTYAKSIAKALNGMMKDETMKGTSLYAMVEQRKVEHPFDEKNVWAVHRHPVAQAVATMVHTRAMHQTIDTLHDQGKLDERRKNGLFVISHNLPQLAKRIAQAVGEGRDAPVNDKDGLKAQRAANPSLYSLSPTLLSILEKASAYAEVKGQQVARLDPRTSPLDEKQVPLLSADAREGLNALIKNMLEKEQAKPDVPAAARDEIGELLKELHRSDREHNRVPVQRNIAAKPDALPRHEPMLQKQQPMLQKQPGIEAAAGKAPAAKVVAAKPAKQRVDDAYRPSKADLAKSNLGQQHNAIEKRKTPVAKALHPDSDEQEKALVKKAVQPGKAPGKGVNKVIQTNSI